MWRCCFLRTPSALAGGLNVENFMFLTFTFGALLESFVFAEVLKLMTASDLRLAPHHFRDRDGRDEIRDDLAETMRSHYDRLERMAENVEPLGCRFVGWLESEPMSVRFFRVLCASFPA